MFLSEGTLSGKFSGTLITAGLMVAQQYHIWTQMFYQNSTFIQTSVDLYNATLFSLMVDIATLPNIVVYSQKYTVTKLHMNLCDRFSIKSTLNGQVISTYITNKCEVTYSYITNKCKVTDVFNEGVARVGNMLLLCTYELCNEVIYRVK